MYDKTPNNDTNNPLKISNIGSPLNNRDTQVIVNDVTTLTAYGGKDASDSGGWHGGGASINTFAVNGGNVSSAWESYIKMMMEVFQDFFVVVHTYSNSSRFIHYNR